MGIRRKVRKYKNHIIKKYIEKDEFYIAHRQWVNDRGDELLRYKYDLNSKSVVLDLGGYHGDFAAEITRLFGSEVHVFEPVAEYHEIIVKRFQTVEGVICVNAGLSSSSGAAEISLGEDASSTHLGAENGGPSNKETIRLIDVAEYFERELVAVDLMKINIEGGEFDVLPRLIESGFINSVKNLQIQFHNFVPDATQKRHEIRRQLLKTHDESWCYDFVWENWTLR